MTSLVLYRITRKEYALDPVQLLDGEGGRRASGRWHAQGSPVTYFAESRALGMLERLVHLSIHPHDDHASLIVAKLVVPSQLARPSNIRRISAEELDALDPAWRQPGSRTCLRIGKLWFEEGAHYALQVPSAIIPDEHNVIVNCSHPLTRELVRNGEFTTTPISIDPRIAEIIDVEILRRRRAGTAK